MDNNSSSSHKSNEPEKYFLYVVGTPIGNLSDLSSRAIHILSNVDLIACEDTRQTKKIMSKFQFTNKLISFNKHNSFNKIPKIINDPGMPGICDPGEELIKESKKNGIKIICVPGPCAALPALVSSGLPTSKFTFEGFLPKKKTEREKLLLEISKNEKTSILFESPNRLKNLLNEIKEFCGGEREIIVSRELTKKFEEHIGNNIDQVIKYFESKEVKGEITIVIKGLDKSKQALEFNKNELKKELCDLINAGLKLSEASKYLAKKHKFKKSLIYNMYKG